MCNKERPHCDLVTDLLVLCLCACLAAPMLATGSTDCITEHCIELARAKHAVQAAFLVGKLKKYRGMLPAAEDLLQQRLQLMTQHSPEQRLAFVLRMLDALRAHAKGIKTALELRSCRAPGVDGIAW